MKRGIGSWIISKKDLKSLFGTIMRIENENGGVTEEETIWKEFVNEYLSNNEINIKTHFYELLNLTTYCDEAPINDAYKARLMFLTLRCGNYIPFYINSNFIPINGNPNVAFIKEILNNTKFSNELYIFCYNIAKYFHIKLSQKKDPYYDPYPYILIDIASKFDFTKIDDINEFLKLIDITNVFNIKKYETEDYDNSLVYLFNSEISSEIKKQALATVKKYFFDFPMNTKKDEYTKSKFIEVFNKMFIGCISNCAEDMKKICDSAYTDMNINFLEQVFTFLDNTDRVWDIISYTTDIQRRKIFDIIFDGKVDLLKKYLIKNIKAILSIDGYKIDNKKGVDQCLDVYEIKKIKMIIEEFDLKNVEGGPVVRSKIQEIWQTKVKLDSIHFSEITIMNKRRIELLERMR